MSFKANVNAAYDNTTIIGTDTNRFRENATAFVYNNSFEFKDSMKQANEYTYDANGNLTKDLNKNITGISYNCLNLPNTVTFSDGSTITYIYGADGTKLRTVHKIGSTTTTTDYCGNVIYENGVQKLLYDAALGRFETVDPSAENYFKTSLYAYCGNSPISRIDPTGADWYEDKQGNLRWQEGSEALKGYTNIGSSASIALGNDNYLNFYQNGGILANQAVNAFDLIASCGKLQNQFLGKTSPLSEDSKSALFNSLNSRSIDAIARPIGEAAFGFGAGEFGGMLLGKAIGWAVGKVAGRGTQNAIQSTAHGVQRIAGTTATRGGVLSVNEVRVTKSVGKAFTQADGATVYLHEITPGRFNAVVEGRKGIITTMGNWSQKSINRIAKNYGWNIK